MNFEPERIQCHAAAKILGISMRAVQKLAQAGKLPGAAKIGNRLTFNVTLLRQYVKEQEDALCRVTSISAAPSGGAEFRLPAPTRDEAYERLIGLRPRSGSPNGGRTSKRRGSTARQGLSGISCVAGRLNIFRLRPLRSARRTGRRTGPWPCTTHEAA